MLENKTQNEIVFGQNSLRLAQLSIRLSPFRIDLVTKTNGISIFQLHTIKIFSKKKGWEKITQFKIIEITQDQLYLELIVNKKNSFLLNINIQNQSVVFNLEPNRSDLDWVAIELNVTENEHFLGLGERYDSVDQRGKRITLWVEDGAHAGFTYFPIPFFISSNGYGLFIDTNNKCIVQMATPDEPNILSIRNASSSLKFTVFIEKTPKEILSAYSKLAGTPKVPPKWVFGPWKSRDWQTADQQGIIDDIQKQAELKLPSSVKLIDARWEAAYHTFEFDKSKFPDVKAMIDAIHAQGNKIVVWITPWMAVRNEKDPDEYYYSCAEKNYFPRDENGNIYVHQLGLNPMLIGSCIDFTNPEAVDWWQSQLQSLLDLGVDGFNTDFGEQVPENVVFYNGATGKEMHNIYPVLYNEITIQVMQKNHLPGVLLARSGWHGSQTHSVIWAGDQSSDFSLNSGMHTALIAGQTAGLSGFPYWTCDIGGYFGNPSDEVYMRWTQMGAFSPIMMLHGAGKREPWDFSEAALTNYRKFAKLHTDLFPYIYSYAKIASKTGIPIIRAMALEFPEEPAIWNDNNENQYCFGSELLVAPIHYSFSRTRPVYLPCGKWRDFWTGDLLEGGEEISCRAEINHIPVFARAGSIIPMLDPSPLVIEKAKNDQLQSATENLKVFLYPGNDCIFQLFDGTEFYWSEKKQELTITDSPVTRFVSVRMMDREIEHRFKIYQNQEQLESFNSNLDNETNFTRALISQDKVSFKQIKNID